MATDAERQAWLERVLGISVPAVAPASGVDRALAGWQAVRGTALASLKALEGAFRGMEHPERDKAVILLKAIQANLTAAPTTPQQIRELAGYLNTDDVIAEAEMPNGFGLKIELKKPLLSALAVLHRETGGRA